jgi:hypothetical protein
LGAEVSVTRVLVLEGAKLAIPDEAVEAIEAADEPSPWLPELLQVGSRPADAARRVLCLRGGGRVEVPAAMRFDEGVEVLELPDLLRSIGASQGIVGLANLSEGLSLVCDPRLLMQARAAGAGGGG